MRCLLTVMTAAIAWTAPGRAERQVVEQVAAEVNGERVMLSEVLAEVRGQLAALPADLDAETRQRRRDALIRIHLFEMIRRRLILKEAERELTDAHKQAIETRLNEQLADRARQAGSREALSAALEAEGQTLDRFTTELRQAITISSYLARQTQPGVHITSEKVRDYYERHRSDFERPERRTWRVIVIRPERFARAAEARTRAEEIAARLAAGGDFPALAREFSHGLRADEGGLWGPMTRDEFTIPEVVAAVFSLEAGRTSPVIDTPAALYLVKVEAIEPAVKADFAGVEAQIRERLRQEELARRREEFSRRLEQRAFIRVYYE